MIVRGVIHCHSAYSADATVSLRELCANLAASGFHFVAMTEHAEDISPAEYECYVHDCRRLTTPDFVVVPGLEICSPEGIEIAGIGLGTYVMGEPVERIVARIREQGGIAVWVHPFKHGRFEGFTVECDGIEVLNAKVDGGVAPSFALLQYFRHQRKHSDSKVALFGLDLHHLDGRPPVWIECDVESLSGSSVVAAIAQGKFTNHTGRLLMGSDGTLSATQYCLWLLLRTGYRAWNKVLSVSPVSLRNLIVKLSRPALRWLKRTH